MIEAKVEELRAELAEVEARLHDVDSELQSVAFGAEMGDDDAAQRRSELLAVRASSRNRASELRDAIESGERAAQERDEAARQAEIREAEELADTLGAKQVAAARKVDRAFKQLERGWAAYLAVCGERGGAVRKAGRTWSNAYLTRHLQQALFAGAPNVATHLSVDRRLKGNAEQLETLVP